MSFDRILERTLAAEAAGFDSVWLMDHFAAPDAPERRHVRRLDDRRRARGAHVDDPHRPSRAVRSVPPSRAAREDGGDPRRDLERPARARHRLGLGAEPSCSTFGFGPEPPATRAAQAARDARDPRPDVHRRAVRLRRRALHVARRAADARCPRRARAGAHRRGRPASSRCRSCATTPTGGTARATRSTGSTSCGRWPATRASPRSIRSASRRSASERDDGDRNGQRRFGSWGGVVAGTRRRSRGRARIRGRRGVEGFVCQFGDFGTVPTIERFMPSRGDKNDRVTSPARRRRPARGEDRRAPRRDHTRRRARDAHRDVRGARRDAAPAPAPSITDDDYRAAGARSSRTPADVWARRRPRPEGQGAAGVGARATCAPTSCCSPTSTSPRIPTSPRALLDAGATGIALRDGAARRRRSSRCSRR